MTLQESYNLMRDHAGYIVGQRALGAWGLALAEQRLMQSDDYRVRWEEDEYPDTSWADAKQLEWIAQDGVRVAVLEHKCPTCGQWEHVDSLGGIVESPDSRERDAYRRVVAAELMAEAAARGSK